MWRQGGTKELQGYLGGPNGQLVAVAIDFDKTSHNALKWAADHVLSKNQTFYLIHVRRRIPGFTSDDYDLSDDMDDAIIPPEELDYKTKEMLLPFQVFCSRKGLQCKEVILEDSDIPAAIVSFVKNQNIDKLIMGVSSRNAFTRTFRQPDVPTTIFKIAPEFCSIYVISKGKVSSIRHATRLNEQSVTRPESDTVSHQYQSAKSEPEMGTKRGGIQPANFSEYSYKSAASCPSPSRSYMDNRQTDYPPRDQYSDHHGSRPTRMSNESRRPPTPQASKPAGEESWLSSPCSGGYSSAFSYEDSSKTSWSSSSLTSGGSLDDVDSEIRRLRMELNKTLDLYGSACKIKKFEDEAISEKPTTNSGIPTANSIDSPKTTTKKTEPEAKKAMVTLDSSLTDAISSSIRYRRYSAEEIQKATSDFSDDLKIGEGGYGPVYKSTLDHTVVAIKILNCDAVYGIKQFQQEVEVLSCIRHPNMVLLMGACPEYGCLVYEFMSNGSLEDRLFCQGGTPPLTWQRRFKIAAEIATGLLFLHQTKPEPLVHRDLKPANILLDDNYVSKIADVGLARLIPPAPPGSQSTQFRMTAAAGTFCYIDPEYQKTGMLGIKSDVYALGIILLQLVTGAPPMGLAHNVERAFEKGKLEEVLDPKVPDWPMEEMPRFTKLALKCVELRRRDRPDLGQAVLPEVNRLRALAESSLAAASPSPWS